MLRHQVDEHYVCFVPVLKGQLSFDAAVVSLGDGADRVGFVVPHILFAHLGRWRQLAASCGEGDDIVVLRIREPGATAIHYQVPLVPCALVVLVNNSSDSHKRMMAVHARSADLNGSTIWRKVSDWADLFPIILSSNRDGFAVFADCLNAA